MYDNFSNIHLYFSERFKLFLMRFKKEVSGEFLGNSLRGLLLIKFITSNYPFTDTQKAEKPSHTVYSLTDRYFRYCLYRREKFMDSKIWPLIISVAASIITSAITAIITTQMFLR